MALDYYSDFLIEDVIAKKRQLRPRVFNNT